MERSSEIGYEVNTLGQLPWLRLSYTLMRTNEVLAYRLRLVTTRPRFGGVRWWFVCPLSARGVPCGRRVGKLYLPPGGRREGGQRPCVMPGPGFLDRPADVQP
jgi:hypothetical protein